MAKANAQPQTPITDLPNIGKILGQRLAAIGVTTRADLESIGAARGYRLLCDVERRRLPVCYNLYSLEAALVGCDWRHLDEPAKTRLKAAAGI